LRIRR